MTDAQRPHATVAEGVLIMTESGKKDFFVWLLLLFPIYRPASSLTRTLPSCLWPAGSAARLRQMYTAKQPTATTGRLKTHSKNESMWHGFDAHGNQGWNSIYKHTEV